MNSRPNSDTAYAKKALIADCKLKMHVVSLGPEFSSANVKYEAPFFHQIAGIGVYVTFLNRKVNYGLGEYIKLLRTDNNKEEIT